MNTCSVIIVNYNTGAMLGKVVQAAQLNKQVAEIIIVDNNSHDNSMALVVDNDCIKKYYLPDNLGFASSCNYGAKRASCAHLLFLNPDCIVGSSSISKLLDDLLGLQDAAIIGCRVNNPDGSEQRACRRRLPTLTRAIKTFVKIEKLAKHSGFFTGVNLNHQQMPVNTVQVEAISGAFMLIKNAVFKQINGFDAKFPLHFEDLDLFKRITDLGYKIYFNPQVSVVHHQGISSQSNPKVAQLKKQGLLRYFKKHCSRRAYIFVKVVARLI